MRNPKERLNDESKKWSKICEENNRNSSQKRKVYDSEWHSVHSFPSASFSQSKLVKEYIEEYFRVHASENTKPFDEIFEERFLERILIKTRLYAGDQNVGKVSKYMTPVEIGELYTSKELNILSSNKKTFSADEAVSLDLQLKNIDKLTVKIFNFVPENYYLKNLAAFNHHVDLDGNHAHSKQTH